MKENEKNDMVMEMLDIWDDVQADNRDAIMDGTRDDVCDTDWAMLSDIIATLCMVDKDTILGGDRQVFHVQCRWLLWLAYRHMTNAPYPHIRHLAMKHGMKVTSDGIRKGVERMMAMTKGDYEWQQRWNMISDIIQRRKGRMLPLREKTKVVVIVPRHVDVEVRKQ